MSVPAKSLTSSHKIPFFPYYACFPCGIFATLAAMAILKPSFLFSRKSAEAAREASPAADVENPADEKTDHDEKADVRVSSNDVPGDDVQGGVQKIQAVRLIRASSHAPTTFDAFEDDG